MKFNLTTPNEYIEITQVLETYIALANDAISKKLTDAAGDPDPVQVEFWIVYVYWELQLYASMQGALQDLWATIQSKPSQLDQTVLNIYVEFRTRTGLNAARWDGLVDVLANACSLHCANTSNYTANHPATGAVNPDIHNRSLKPEDVRQLIVNNPWVVPILLYKMGPKPITVDKKRRGGHTSM